VDGVTARTVRLVDQYFGPDERDLVISELVDRCGNDLPWHQSASPTDLERVRFAVLKLSEGDLDEFESAVAMATTDWRDVLVCAGFAYDTRAHETWADARLGNSSAQE